MYSQPGATRVWQLGQDLHGAGQGTVVYNLTDWSASAGLGHLSHENAQAGVPVAQQMACTSSAERQNLPRVNEIVCFRLDGSRTVLVVAPNMTDLNASGGGSDDYSKRPKGNLDPTGEYFIWTTNLGTNRSDAFIVRIPQQKLGVSGGAATPSPTPAPHPRRLRRLRRLPRLRSQHRRPHRLPLPRQRLLHRRRLGLCGG
jgi:hypothetical protein